MRLYSVGEMPVNGPKRNGKQPLMITEGVYFWEIARQSKEGFWVRKHGQPKALHFVPCDLIGECYFTEPKEVLAVVRARLRRAIKSARNCVATLEREYAAAKRGMVYTNEWSPKSIRPLPDGPSKLAPSGAAPKGLEGGAA
jgi:hypothetical protein